MATPSSEVKAVTPYLYDYKQMENMVLYLRFIKKYYELDRTIYNLAKERAEVLQHLFNISWTFDLKEFEKHSVRLMLTARRLTTKLVKLVKEWKRLRLNKPTFLVEVID